MWLLKKIKYISLQNKNISLHLHIWQDNQEYRDAVFKGYLGSFNRTKKHSAATFRRQSGAVLPDTVDWREKGYVTDVKAGKCSWAFSAVREGLTHGYCNMASLLQSSTNHCYM